MDFELSSEQKDIRQAAREFALGELKDIAGECDQNVTFPSELIKKAGELGFLGVFIPARIRSGSITRKNGPSRIQYRQYLSFRCPRSKGKSGGKTR